MPMVYRKGSFFNSFEDINGKHITVMGLGLNGGGEATVRFFLRHGASVIVTDMKDENHLRHTIESIENNPPIDGSLLSSRLTYHLGGHKIDDFVKTDCVIKNPGVKYEGNKYLCAAMDNNIPIESDISVFLSLTTSPIIAVTGSKGKSSTVSALHWVLTHTGFNAFLGGNITVSPLTFIEKTNKSTPVVLELSSWQLADLRGRGLLRAHISIIAKIVPDHQNWYGDMTSYVADKKLVYADQGQGDYAIFDIGNSEDNWGEQFAQEAMQKCITVLRYSSSVLPDGVCGAWQEDAYTSMGISDLSETVGKVRLADGKERVVMRSLLVPGQHVRTNVLNAALAAVLMGAAAGAVCNALASWPGIAHRLQLCHQWVHSSEQGTVRVQFYDDSCSTVAEAAMAAAQSFNTPIILITGGTDKGLPQDALAECIKKGLEDGSILEVYLIAGTATDRLVPLLEQAENKRCLSLGEYVRTSSERGGTALYMGPFDSLDELLSNLKIRLNDGGNLRMQASYSNGTVQVVFSPGSTSFGMFENEFDRGNKFQDAVRRMF